MGPALILTSIVLACGLAALTFSSLPSLRLFGWLSAFAMLAALVADFLILRPAITFVTRVARTAYFNRLGSHRNDATATSRNVKELDNVHV